jgi:hypothetical protein
VGNDKTVQNQIITALHDSAVGGHLGTLVTYKRVKQMFAWRGLKSDVQNYVQHYQVCIQAKYDRSAYPGKLQLLPVPSEAWKIITMDFIKGLPKSAGAACILVVADKFTCYCHFIAISHPYTTHSVALAFLNSLYKLHGLPASIVSDRDLVLTSHFWQHLFKLAGVILRLSSAYHPQSGQTERINQCLETFLRCFV